jgi:hypothetical protein
MCPFLHLCSYVLKKIETKLKLIDDEKNDPRTP